MRDTKMYRLGHAGVAMESTAIINIAEVFVTNDNEKSLQAVLKDCSLMGGMSSAS
jgi:hypothetical protein